MNSTTGLDSSAVPIIENPMETPAHGLTLLVFSSDLDKVMAAFTLATGAASMGLRVSMFFTMWGLVVLKRQTIYQSKSLLEKLLAAMLPSGPAGLRTSRLNCLGLGPRLLGYRMRKRQVASLQDLMALAQELHIRMVACQTSMELMGFRREELIANAETGGVASLLDEALNSKITLFV